MKLEMKLIRFMSLGGATIGMLMFGGHSFVTLENEWKQNEKNISCIPNGCYSLHKTENRRTFGGMLIPLTYEVEEVPGRSGILFHIGNYESDTSGCILLGRYWLTVRDHKPMICQSKDAFNHFVSLIKKNPNSGQLTVASII